MPDYSIKKHDNGVFYVHWTVGRRSRCVSTRSKDMVGASAFLAEWAKLDREEPARGVLTVADVWNAYFVGHVLKSVSSPDTAKYAWRNMKDVFGRLTPDQITQDVVDRYIVDRQEGLIGKPSKSGTIRRELTVLRAALNWAASPRRKLIAADSVPVFDLPPDSQPRDRWLTEEEVQRLADAAASHPKLSLFVALATETAARRGAILDLTWDRVDLQTGVIDYRNPDVRATKKRRAVIPVSTALRATLEQALAARTDKYVIGPTFNVNLAMTKAAKRAGLEHVSPHVLRHTFATLRMRKGAPLWLVAKCLANNQTTTEKTYAHHSPEDLRATVEMR